MKQRRYEVWRSLAEARSKDTEHQGRLREISGKSKLADLTGEEVTMLINHVMSIFDSILADYDLYMEGIFNDEDMEFFIRQVVRDYTEDNPLMQETWDKIVYRFYPEKFTAFIGSLKLKE